MLDAVVVVPDDPPPSSWWPWGGKKIPPLPEIKPAVTPRVVWQASVAAPRRGSRPR
jgi:hypothetical protein